MANKVHYGLCNVHYATYTVSNGTVVYNGVQSFPGAVSLSLAPEGDEYIFRADNMDYWKSAGDQGYSGSFEFAEIPEDFATNILKRTLDTKNVEFENKDDVSANFALGFQVEGDEKATKFWFYNCSVSRNGIDAQTTGETTEVQTTTLDLTAKPSVDLGIVRAKTRSNTDTTVYEGWFSSVVLPTV